MYQETKLKELFDLHWKGIMSYDEYNHEEKTLFKKSYSAEEFYEVLKAAYNMGIKIAADMAEAELELIDDPVVGEYQDATVNRDSILKLQVE